MKYLITHNYCVLGLNSKISYGGKYASNVFSLYFSVYTQLEGKEYA